ncbi:LPS-assembly lipoprotein LptE [Candidatus Erwinia haradaeae]|uniref:LPS-assembly lipoprotein LptE n=1 Tax=Candidatus Erwinia haradaeae TaxID=1922217 RepID=A0A451CZ11_9GAMM|nr:LPS assembly lipoprotein LptE [Candidatus Erwinia haradaeae]VFP78666.1 LPS-assembly lipoprotein LptE [Candidatus Erwinia haradaeae]
MNYIKFSLLLIISMTICMVNGCGYHLHRAFTTPDSMKNLIVHTADLYSPLTVEMYKQLRQYDVNIINQESTKGDIPSFHLGKEILHRNTTTTFYDGKTAEYSIVMIVKAHMVIPNQGFYPIISQVSSSFFENPHTPLAKDAEESLIIYDIRKKVVSDLIHQISRIYLETTNATKKINNPIRLKNSNLSPRIRPETYCNSNQ